MEFGVHLPLISIAGEQRSLGDLLAFTEAARELGYTHLCANDHLVFSRPWLDGPTALAAVLAQSGQMTLATTVAVPVLRGPAATAKILAAIDLLSGGRLLVGVGPGSSARDYELVGVPFEERWKRLDEAVETLRAHWRADDVAFEGAFYSTAGFSLTPTPAQRPGPPIWIGSWGSPAGLRRVARLADGWLASGYNTTPELFAQAWVDVQAEVTARGRDGAQFPNGIATMWCYVTEDRAAPKRCSQTCWCRCSIARRRSSAPFFRSARPKNARRSSSRTRAPVRNASSFGRLPMSALSSSCFGSASFRSSKPRAREAQPGARREPGAGPIPGTNDRGEASASPARPLGVNCG